MAVLELRQNSTVWWEQTLFGEQGEGSIVDNEVWTLLTVDEHCHWNDQRIYDPQGRLRPWR